MSTEHEAWQSPRPADHATMTDEGATAEDAAAEDDSDNEPSVVHPTLPANIDEIPRARSSMLPYEAIPAGLGEALRGIINRHELRTGAPLPKSIAVTSALLGEGVTTTSQALATLIAHEMGSFVCWVDCSWLSADAPSDHGISRPSLIEILSDKSRIVSAFETSPDLQQLVSLSPGPVPASQRNLIVRSPEFERLLGVLAHEFDHVVFDIPPVLANANGLALLRRADIAMLVVKHRSTSIAQIERVVDAIQPTPNIGVVLNHYRTSIPTRLRRLLSE
jgi:Mrp family chromosome partitioning ATPase